MKMERPLFTIADYSVFACSLMVCAFIGMYQAYKTRNHSSTGQYLMGDRNFHVIPLTLSLVVSVISAVTVLGLPAEMYTQGSQYLFNIGSGLGIVLTAFIFVPLLHPLKLTSMFEYLERRFESRAVRLVGSLFEILSLTLYGGIALFGPATALESVTELPAWIFSLILGILVTFYTSMGGLKAVIWTDVYQAFIMVVGLLVVIIQGCISVGGIGKVLSVNREGGRLQFYDFDPDPSTRHTFWGLTLGFSMGSLSFYGASQFTFQRFSATKSLRDAKMTVLLNIPTFYMFHIMLCFTGLIIYAYYANLGCDPIKSGVIKSSNQLLPLFVMDTLSFLPGLPGVFVAALTSGAMSTISSAMNSISALIWEDLLKSKLKFLSQAKATIITKLTVCCCGGVIIALTFLADNFGPHIFQVCFAFLGASGGPQLGMFLLGALVPWANSKGALCGCLAGILMTSWITIGTFVTKPFTPPLPPAPSDGCFHDVSTNLSITTAAISNVTFHSTNYSSSASHLSGISRLYTLSYTWYSAVGVATCMLVGMAVSLATGKCKSDPVLVLPWIEHIKNVFRKFPRCSEQHSLPSKISNGKCSVQFEEAEKMLENGLNTTSL